MNYWAELRQEGIYKSRKRREKKNYEHIQKITERIYTKNILIEEINRERERQKHNRETLETQRNK